MTPHLEPRSDDESRKLRDLLALVPKLKALFAGKVSIRIRGTVFWFVPVNFRINLE